MPRLNEYTPPPSDLSGLNPIQRYMQRGLTTQDYAYLFIFVLAYIAARPYVKKGAKWLLAPKELIEAERIQNEYYETQEAKVSANEIRAKGNGGESVMVDGTGDDVKASGREEETGNVVNRKAKTQTPATSKSEEEKLLDWDDEPARAKVEGDKGDVVSWLNKWDE